MDKGVNVGDQPLRSSMTQSSLMPQSVKNLTWAVGIGTMALIGVSENSNAATILPSFSISPSALSYSSGSNGRKQETVSTNFIVPPSPHWGQVTVSFAYSTDVTNLVPTFSYNIVDLDQTILRSFNWWPTIELVHFDWLEKTFSESTYPWYLSTYENHGVYTDTFDVPAEWGTFSYSLINKLNASFVVGEARIDGVSGTGSYITATFVPEPSAVWLGMAGAVGLLLRRRRSCETIAQ